MKFLCLSIFLMMSRVSSFSAYIYNYYFLKLTKNTIALNTIEYQNRVITARLTIFMVVPSTASVFKIVAIATMALKFIRIIIIVFDFVFAISFI